MTPGKLVHDDPVAQPLRSLSGLVDFDCAARLESFKLAAEALHKTPAAESLQVRQLEASLGFPLFERHPRRLVLTGRGRAFAEVLARALAELRAKAQALREGDDAALLRIGATHSFALKWLAPRLGRFTARHPQFDVRVAASDVPVDLAAGGVEVALRYGPAPADDPAVLWREQLVAVVAPALLPAAVRRAARAPAAGLLARLPLLYEGAPESWSRFLAGRGLAVPAASFVRGFSHAGLLAQAAAAGQGAALVPYAMAHDDLAAGTLRRLDAPALPNGRGYRFLVDARRRDEPRVRLLRAWLAEEMDEMRAALAAGEPGAAGAREGRVTRTRAIGRQPS